MAQPERFEGFTSLQVLNDHVNMILQIRVHFCKVSYGLYHQTIKRLPLAFEQVEYLEEEIDLRRIGRPSVFHIHKVIIAQNGAIREDKQISRARTYVLKNGATGVEFFLWFNPNLKRHASDSFVRANLQQLCQNHYYGNNSAYLI
jgi:hypothetical protein